MSPPRRVLLIGRWPDADRLRTGFPELRTQATAHALRAAGLEVTVAGLVPPGAAPAPGAAPVIEEGPGWLDAIARVGEGCEVVVGAGPHNAGRAAALVAGGRPTWVDVPGDPFAEVQAVALAEGAPRPDRQAAASAALLPGLARADGFGAVSAPQRLLLLGQLGLAGRLATPTALDPVAVVPVAWSFPDPPAPPRPRAPGTPLVVLLGGSFNAWLDVDTLIAGLEGALGRAVDRVLVTGGPAEGHHDAAWERFGAWARRQGGRVQVSGRVPAPALPALAARAHVALSLDRPGLEPETGSRTRVLYALHQGLEVIATTRTPLCAELAAAGLLHAVPPGQPRAVTEALEALHRDGAGVEARQRARAGLEARYRPEVAHAPVVRFVQDPWRLPPVAHPMAELAAAHAALLDERARLHATPTWRTLSTLHRILRGRRG